MAEQKDGVIEFGTRSELKTEQADDYHRRIEKARKTGSASSLKQSEPVGVAPKIQGLPNLPQFQAEQRRLRDPGASTMPGAGGVQPRPAGSPVITDDTADMLTAAAKAAKDKNQAALQNAPTTEEEKKEAEKKLDEDLLDLFDFEKKNEAQRVLENPKRRKAIEERTNKTNPMSFKELLERDEVRQKVVIIPGEFEPTYRSLTPEENFFVKKMMAAESGSDQYMLEKFAMMQLCCSLVDINGTPLVDHRNPNGEVDVQMFDKKMKQLMKKSLTIIADLGLNYAWFDIRVRKLINPDELKNG